MKTYKVTISYRGSGVAEVQADSEAEAIKLAEDDCCDQAMAEMSRVSAYAEEVAE